MRNLKLIISREFQARVRNKTFMVMTFLSPLIFVGMIVLIAYLSNLYSDEVRVIGVNDQSGEFISEFYNTEKVEFQDLSALSLPAAQDLAQQQELFALLHIPRKEQDTFGQVQFFAKEAPGFGFLENIEKTIADKMTSLELKARGVDVSEIEDAQQSLEIQLKTFSGERTSEMSSYVKMFFGGAAGYLLMMFIVIYGNMVMRSVIEEKTNRIVEIIISSVKPLHLMLGKIIGTSFAGISQFIIWVILGTVMLTALAFLTGVDFFSFPPPQPTSPEMTDNNFRQLAIDIAQLPLLSLCFYFLVYFIGGYFLYSSIYAAIGAAVDSETDTQQFMLPVILPLMLGIYVGFFSVIENPHGMVATIFSMVPLTSPIVMLMRIPFGVPWWEPAISISLLVISIFATVWMAAKIYRVGILMYGKKPGYKDLLKWLKY